MDKITSYLRNLRINDPRAFASALYKMNEDEVISILYDWEIWGRDKQLEPSGEWRFWVALGGRSSGKTRTGAEWVIKRAREGKSPIALIGQTAADVRDVMIEAGPSSIMKVSPPSFMPKYEPSKRRLTWPNGSFATTFSGDEPQQLRGPQHQTVWVDELPKFADPQETFDQMNFGLRIGESRCLITTTPTPHPLVKMLHAKSKDSPLTRLVVMPTIDNASNIDANFLKDIEDKYKGTRLYRQEVLGEILWESDNALFSSENIDRDRVEGKDVPTLYKKVVAIDPAVTASKKSDTTALVVCGVDEEDHGYVLHSTSMKVSPSTWARAAVNLYDEFDCDYVVVETNNGGDLIRTTLEQERRGLPIKEVRAAVNKIARMEPISLLAEQGKVHIVGVQDKLEDQLVRYEGKGKSPDLYDAMCWGLTSLMISRKGRASSITFDI